MALGSGIDALRDGARGGENPNQKAGDRLKKILVGLGLALVLVVATAVPAVAVYESSLTASVYIYIPGDANEDGYIDVFDLVKVKRIILGLDPATPGADANLDGEVDVFDLVKVKRIILGIEP